MRTHYDLSILIPAIRQNRWLTLYDSMMNASKDHKVQLILVSPFDLPEELKKYPNIKLVKDFGCVSRCVQLGMLDTESDLVFLTVDDCVFVEDSIDYAIYEYNAKCVYRDALNVRYSENGDIQSSEYYGAYYHQSTRLLGINPNWQLCPQFIINKHYYMDLGGFDCRFEYINEAVHDFAFRLQKSGGKIYHSTKHCCVATWYPNTTGDHAPIHYAQTEHDWPIFYEMYKQPNSRMKIPYNNWQNSPSLWLRRFNNGVPSSYEELVKRERYKV